MGYHQLMGFHHLLGFQRHFRNVSTTEKFQATWLGFTGVRRVQAWQVSSVQPWPPVWLWIFRTSPLPLFSEEIRPYLGEILKGSMLVLISFSVQLIERKGTIWWTKELLQEVAVCKVNILWNSSATLLYSCWIPFLILQARWHIFGRNVLRATLWQSNIRMDNFRWEKTKCSNRPCSIAMQVFE